MSERLSALLRSLRARRWLRLAPIFALLLLLPGGVSALHLGHGPSEGFAGSFELGPGSLPAGSAGGSALQVSAAGSEADLTVWVPAGVPTYFLDVLEFRFGGSSPERGTLSVQLPPTPGSLPAGAELLVLVGTPSNGSSPGGSLTTSPAVPSGELLGFTGLGGPEDGLGPVLAGWEESSTGLVTIAQNSSAPFSLAAGVPATLVLDLGLFLPGSFPGTIPSLFQLDVSLALSS